MCGIAGFVGGDWSGKSSAQAALGPMVAGIRHRGPDRQAEWIEPQHKIALANNRLAILDLSEAGSQPMHSPNGRHVVTYNGEIYNHLELRDELAKCGKGEGWTGHSDTETLLSAIMAWGIRGALDRLVGMFAFALWDRSDRTLTLARDRLGEKPLYYGRQHSGGPFLFASELKALTAHPGFQKDIDRTALSLLLRYGYVPAPHSIYRGIRKLAPGSLLTLAGPDSEPVIEQYWSAHQTARSGRADQLAIGEGEAVDELERLLDRTVGQQMIADVPLGAFLSGGVDSSAIVATMQKLSSRRVKTFTIGFREKAFDEAAHAEQIARHLGTEHTEIYVTAEEAREVIPRLPQIYDEPFADSSQIPTHFVAALARQHVTVALSGDGGDELFGGYNRYLLTAQLWDRLAAMPKVVRRTAARAITAVPPSAWTRFGTSAAGFLPRWARVDRLGEKLHKGAPLLASGSADDLYDGMVSLWRDPAEVVIGGIETGRGQAPVAELDGLSPVERMMAMDLTSYLPDDILVKVDRAAMAVSLETRVPFLDHRIVEFAWRLPLDMKIRGGQTKWLLRELLHRSVPRELVERPKMGFAIPLGEWLSGPLREWAEDLLDESRLCREGYFRPGPIRQLWSAHLAGKVDAQAKLWPVLAFQSWLQAQREAGETEPSQARPRTGGRPSEVRRAGKPA